MLAPNQHNCKIKFQNHEKQGKPDKLLFNEQRARLEATEVSSQVGERMDVAAGNSRIAPEEGLLFTTLRESPSVIQTSL